MLQDNKHITYNVLTCAPQLFWDGTGGTGIMVLLLDESIPSKHQWEESTAGFHSLAANPFKCAQSWIDFEVWKRKG